MRTPLYNIKWLYALLNLRYMAKTIPKEPCDDDNPAGKLLLGIVIFAAGFALSCRLGFFNPYFSLYRCRSPPSSFPLKIQGKEEKTSGKRLSHQVKW